MRPSPSLRPHLHRRSACPQADARVRTAEHEPEREPDCRSAAERRDGGPSEEAPPHPQPEQKGCEGEGCVEAVVVGEGWGGMGGRAQRGSLRRDPTQKLARSSDGEREAARTAQGDAAATHRKAHRIPQPPPPAALQSHVRVLAGAENSDEKSAALPHAAATACAYSDARRARGARAAHMIATPAARASAALLLNPAAAMARRWATSARSMTAACASAAFPAPAAIVLPSRISPDYARVNA